ncbi:Transcription termination factor 1, partial [Ophiophagus hannah]
MNDADILLVEDTQQPSYEKKTKKSRKRSREEVKQPIVSSEQTSHSSQDTEDSGTSRKKHKKKKSSLETSDASWVIPETQQSDESEINNFVPKKKKTKMKHRLKHGIDEEGWSPSTPNKSSQLSLKKASANGGVDDDDEFWSPSTTKKSSKLSRKEDLGNVSVVDGNRSSHKKKKRKRREEIHVPDGPAKEKSEATSSQKEDQVDLDQTIDTQMDFFGSSPLSFSEGPQVVLHPGHGQERSRSPTAEDSEATQVDLEMEGTSAGDHEQTQPRSPSKLSTSGVNTKLDQSRTGRKLRSSRKQSPSETCSEEEEEDAYALDKEQLENARKELEEFIPRAKTLSDSAVRQLAKRDLARFRELKKKGLAVRFGVFSQAENNLLTENIEAFLEESGIETSEKLLFSNRFPEEEAEIKRLKCQYLFCERI